MHLLSGHRQRHHPGAHANAYSNDLYRRYMTQYPQRLKSSQLPSDDYGLPISAVINENWQGKSDPTERRRIQNRLNQRNYRARQRAEPSPQQSKRSTSGRQGVKTEDDEEEQEEEGEEDRDEDLSLSQPPQGRSVSASVSSGQPQGVTDESVGRWDELGQLINRNLMQASVANAQQLGIDLDALRASTAIYTPQHTDRSPPPALAPGELQFRVPHDPIFDVIPHPRLRYNILRATVTRQIDGAELSRCIRSSGALEKFNGVWQRGGLVVWSSPEQVGSWELSEPWVTRWAVLLDGCEDLIAVTNAWRQRRGEKLFPASIQRLEEDYE